MRKLWFLAAVLATVTACAQTPSPAPAPQAPAPQATGRKAGPSCLDSTTQAKHITFGEGLVGIVLGTGTTGVVLAHQNGGSVCQWLVTAEELVQKGYRVLAFDFAGFGGSALVGANPSTTADVTEAVKAIRAEGVTKVALVGGSMGGTAVVAAAATISPPVQAVISLSAPAAFGKADALSAAPKLTMPVLYMSAIGESTYTQNAKDMHAASKASADPQLLVVKGSEHGVSVVMTGVGTDEAIKAFYGFLAKHAPAG